MNAQLTDELQKEYQTEVEKLELRANTSFQETSDVKKVQMRTKSCCREGRETGNRAPRHT
jgi:hypothetical protein